MSGLFRSLFGGSKGEESLSSHDQAKRTDHAERAPELRTTIGREKDANRKRSPTPPSVFDVDRYRAAGLQGSGSRSPSPDPLAMDMDRDYDEHDDSRYRVGTSKTKDNEQDCRRKIEISATANPYNKTFTSSSASVSSSVTPQRRDLSKDIKSSRGRDNQWPQNHDKKPNHSHRPHQQQHQPRKIVFNSSSGRDGSGYCDSDTGGVTASSAMQKDFEELRRQREDNRTVTTSHHWTNTNTERRSKDDRDRDRNRHRKRYGRDKGSSRSRHDDDRTGTAERGEGERVRPKDENRDPGRSEQQQPPAARPRTPDSGTMPMDQDSPLPPVNALKRDGDTGLDCKFGVLPFTVESSNQQHPGPEAPIPPAHQPSRAAAPMDTTPIIISDSDAQENQGFTQYTWPPEAQPQAGPVQSLSGWRDNHDDGAGRTASGAQIRELEKIIEQKTNEALVQEADNLDLHQQLAGAKMAISQLRQNNKDLSDTLHTERERAREIKSALSKHEQLKRSYQQLEREYTSKVALLKTRTEELTLAQAYMTTADRCSVADISRMVEQLNDDMYQFAVLISDAVLHAKSSKAPLPNDIVLQARRVLEETWGERLVRRMYTAVAEEITVLLECFVQYVLANWCHDVVRSFVDNPDAENRLQALWEGIKQSQQPSIARNWLAITYSEVKTQEFNPSHTMQDLANLISASGWAPVGDAGVRLNEQIHSKFAELTAKTRKIKQMVFEGTLSADVRTRIIPLAARYDPEEMEDAHDMASGRSSGGEGFNLPTRQDIVCTVGLGLTETRRMQGSDKQPRIEERNVVLKPKVLLSSTLDNL